METNIKLLEERTLQVLERLRGVTAERNRLGDDVTALRKSIEQLEDQRAELFGGLSAETWRQRMDEVVVSLRNAIAELREPGAGPSRENES